MSVQKIHLRKLLLLFDATAAERRRLLRNDITSDLRKEAKQKAGKKDEGGDFHTPFWAAAKQHVAGETNLRSASVSLVQKNKARERLYPVLADGFLRWWDEKRRWRNESFKLIPQVIKARLEIPELKSTIKIENLLALEIVGQFSRVVYPYFDEQTPLTRESARLGIWVMHQSFKQFAQQDLRILDILRSTSFGVGDNPFRGNERKDLLEKYSATLKEWKTLKKEYGK